MGGITKFEKSILGVMFVVQLVLVFTVDPLLAVLAPPLLAAVPIGYATLGNDRTVKMMTPKRRRRAYLSIVLLFAGVAASFILTDSDLPFRLRIAQALFVDAAILWLAATVATSLNAQGTRTTVNRGAMD